MATLKKFKAEYSPVLSRLENSVINYCCSLCDERVFFGNTLENIGCKGSGHQRRSSEHVLKWQVFGYSEKLKDYVLVEPSLFKEQFRVTRANKHHSRFAKENMIRITAEKSLCTICMDDSRNQVFLPCKHCITCERCSIQCENCPICRTNIVQRMKIYLN